MVTQVGVVELVGANSLSTSFGSCMDDAPAINAYMSANPDGGVLTLVNPVLKTPMDLSLWGDGGNVIRIVGVLRYLMNVAELDLPGITTLEGVGGGSGSIPEDGIGTNQGSFAFIQGFNSKGGSSPEPKQTSSTAYIGSPAHQLMYDFFIDEPIPASSIGDTFTISSASEGEGYVGSYVYLGSTNSPNSRIIARLIYTGSLSSAPSGTCGGAVWSCGSVSGTSASTTSFAAPVPVLKVEGLSNVPMATCWKHWLSMSNCSNAVLNNKIHRIMGADSTTSAYVSANAAIAYETALGGSLTLPDYGVGGSSGSHKIKAYEAAPSVRLGGSQACVKNVLSWASQGPAFVMDGSGSSGGTQQTMSNCGAWGDGAGPAFCPYINDGVFWYYVRGFYASNNPDADPSTCPASMLLTCNDSYAGQYCGIGRIEDVELSGYGVVLMSETGMPVVGNKFVNLIQELPVDYPGTSWNAVVTLMPVLGGVSDLELSDVSAADGGQYVIESLLAPPTSPEFGAAIGNVRNVVLDNPSFAGTFPPYGPNLSASNATLLNDFGSLQAGTFNFSARSAGLYDTIEVGAQDSFAPVITLPAQFRIPLPPLLTVPDWEALPGDGCTFSTTDSGGNPLWGPDMSLGRVIRIHSKPDSAQVTVATWTQPSTNVGDLMLFYARVKNPNPAASLDAASGYNSIAWTNVNVFIGNGNSNIVVSLLDPQVNPAIFERTGSLWTDVVNIWPVTFTKDTGKNIYTLKFGGGADDLIVDPESIAVYYIPASGSFDPITIAEKQRLYRKVRSQVGTATPGDVAVPSRTGISFGAAARTGALPPLTTTSTSPAPIYTYPVPPRGAFQIELSWLAVQPGPLSATSSGVCTVSGHNSGGTITVSPVNTLGTNYNTGPGGAAAATPVTVTTGPGTVIINVAAESTTSTDWQGFVKVLNA